MDVEKLIDHLKECGTYGFKQEECREAAEALTTLQIELKGMRGAANSYKAENAKLQAELEKVKAERDAAADDLRVCSIENYMECQYCLYRTARSFCGNCTDGSSWKWCGQKEE